MTQNDMLNATAWILDAAIIQKGKYDFFVYFLFTGNFERKGSYYGIHF